MSDSTIEQIVERVVRETKEEVLKAMQCIIDSTPTAMEYESDARYTWPLRWNKLNTFLQQRRDSDE